MSQIEPFSFLHTGDLHLDTPFVGLSTAAPPAISAHLRKATLGAWDRIVQLALDQRVDFVVVAGDVFEAETRTLMGQLAFADGLERLAEHGVQTAVVTGNHDPLSGWEATVEWPAAAHRFGAEEVGRLPILRDGKEIARVYGISYGSRVERRDLAAKFHREADVPFAVGLLHGTIGPSERHEPYAPTSEQVLIDSGMDYWALGHIHSRRVVRGERPCVVYPGNPQGRDPGEPEPRGVALVRVDADGTPHPEFVDTDVLRWVILDLDLSSIASITVLRKSIRQAIQERLQEAERSLVVRVRLTGFAPLHDELRGPQVLADLTTSLRDDYSPEANPFVWIESLPDQTRSESETAYSRGIDFLAELHALADVPSRSVEAKGGTDTEGESQELDIDGIAAELYGDPRFRRAAELLPSARGPIAVDLEEARVLALDRLRTTGTQS